MEKSITTKYRGIKLSCTGNYEEAESGDWHTPPTRASFETFEVFAYDSDINIIDLFTEDMLVEIDEQIISEWD